MFNKINICGVKIMKNLLLGSSTINRFMQVIPITLLIGLLYIIFRFIYLRRKKADINYKKEIFYLIFVCYLTGLLNLVLVPAIFWGNIWYYIFYGYSDNPFAGMFEFSYNFVPTLYKIIKGEYLLGSWISEMLVGNILMFIPMGILLPLCFKSINNKKSILKYAILVPLAIELIQPTIGRSFDIDDLIMNFLGIIIGYFLVYIINNILKNRKNKSTK